LGRVVQDAPYGFIGIANNINPLLESFQRLKVETGSTKAALSSLLSSLGGGAGLGLAVSVATSLLSYFAIQGLGKTGQEADKATDKIKGYNEILKSVSKSVAQEATEVLGLVAVLKNETETRDRKLSAIKELQQIQPEIFKGLRLEQDAVLGLDQAYRAYLDNLRNAITAKILQAQIEEKISRQLMLQQALGLDNQKSIADQLKSLKPLTDAQYEAAKSAKLLADNTKLFGLGITSIQAGKELNQVTKDIESLAEKLFKLSGQIKVPEIKIKPNKVSLDEINTDHFSKFLGSINDKIPIPELKLQPKSIVIGKSAIVFDPKIADNVLSGIAKLLKEEAAEKLGNEVSQILSDTLVRATANIGDVIASALTGNGLEDAFDGIKKILGAGLKQIGQAIIKANTALLVLKKIQFSNPYVGIAIGIAISALGALLQSQIGKVKAFATGVRNFGGGLALVGERGPELVNLPSGSDVIPNGQLNNMGNMAFEVFGRIEAQGTALVTIIDRARATNRRNN